MRACSYFSSRFPNLLMATFCFGLHRCAEEPMLAKYYPAGALEFPLELMSTRLAAATGAPATAANTVDAIRVQHLHSCRFLIFAFLQSWALILERCWMQGLGIFAELA